MPIAPGEGAMIGIVEGMTKTWLAPKELVIPCGECNPSRSVKSIKRISQNEATIIEIVGPATKMRLAVGKPR
jgi:hypothetical protein